MLRSRFVCGYRNIIDQPYAGNSGAHSPSGNAVDTTNGAGSHNLQLFVLNPDGTVLHCLPGYWNAEDLVEELQLAMKLNDVWQSGMTPPQKAQYFERLQMAHIGNHSSEMVSRSELQGFDKWHEVQKAQTAMRDSRTAVPDTIADASLLGMLGGGRRSQADLERVVKTTDVILHERMAARPFVPYEKFDVAAFTDYGQMVYDKHEDSLDESGRRAAHWNKPQMMKNGNTPNTTVAASMGPKVYVQTYGALRSEGLAGRQGDAARLAQQPQVMNATYRSYGVSNYGGAASSGVASYGVSNYGGAGVASYGVASYGTLRTDAARQAELQVAHAQTQVQGRRLISNPSQSMALKSTN
jgi:hypothetical protein